MRILCTHIFLSYFLSVQFCEAQQWQIVSEELNEYRVVYTLYADTVDDGLI